MKRRSLLGTIAAIGLAGCSSAQSTGSNESENGLILSETVTSDEVFSLDLDADDTLRIEAENSEGLFVVVSVIDPTGTELVNREINDSDLIEVDPEESGTHELWVTPDGTANVEAFIEPPSDS